MATISNVLQMNSNFVAKLSSSISAHFTKVDNSVSTVIKKYQELHNVTINAIDTDGLKAASMQLSKTVGAFDEIGASIKEVYEQQKMLNNETSKGSKKPSIFSKISKSDIFQNSKDAIIEWIKTTDQYAAVQDKLKAMGTEWLSTDSGVKATNTINNALNIMGNSRFTASGNGCH
jgi:hypothetical protein